MVSVTLTAADIPGADLSELLVLFWHRYREKCLEQARDCDFSCLPSIQNTLNHLGLVPGSPGKGARILAWVVATTRYRYVQHTALFSFILRCSRSYFNQFSHFAYGLYRQVPCQTPQSHELCNPYGFSHAQVSNRPLPILPFTAILNVAIKEQPDVTSRQSNSFALVCNWLIHTCILPTCIHTPPHTHTPTHLPMHIHTCSHQTGTSFLFRGKQRRRSVTSTWHLLQEY